MTNDPRYSPSQQAGQRVPNPQASTGFNPAGGHRYGQPQGWRYPPTQQMPQQPYGHQYASYPQPGTPGGPSAPKPGRQRKSSRTIGLAAGALTIAVVSAGVGGLVEA